MRILICDDDPLIIEQLYSYIQFYFEQCHIKCPEIVSFTCGEDLLADNGEKDLVFLDIEMPGVNGIYVGNELKKQNKNILIFVVTAYTEYLDDAMRFHVFRYLSKPINLKRFFRNMKDALVSFNAISAKIPIETKQMTYMVPTSQIIAVEAQGRKVIVHTTSQDLISVRNMNYLADQLPNNCFFRTHRSFIVNFKHITDFAHTTVHLTNRQLIAYLTRRKYSDFKNAYFLYLESTR